MHAFYRELPQQCYKQISLQGSKATCHLKFVLKVQNRNILFAAWELQAVYVVGMHGVGML